ncbi:MAG: hypothetical protein ACJ73S_09050 [Mycobacteriales bacterium]
MTELENVLKATFRDHEHLVDGLGPLLPPVRERIAGRRTRRRLLAAVAALVCAGAAGGTAVVAAAGGGGDHQPAPTTGWRWESSLGLEVQVPADWSVNDLGCGKTHRPTVLRALDTAAVQAPTGCRLQLSPHTDHARIEVLRPAPTDLPVHNITLNGAGGISAEGRTSDGRYTGWLYIRSPQVSLTVVTGNAATTHRILHSARLVAVDHLGCPTRDSDRRTSPLAEGSAPFVPPGQVSAVACLYQPDQPIDNRLSASAALPPANVSALANALNAGQAVHDHSCPSHPEEHEDRRYALVRFRDTGGDVTTVDVEFTTSCVGSVVLRGETMVKLTFDTARLFMDPLHAGFTID